MPNYCSNTLVVTGEQEDLHSFIERAQATLDAGHALCSWYPLPDSASKIVEFESPDGTTSSFSAFSDTGYATALDMWGTKWGDCDTTLNEVSETKIVFWYQTAWGNADRLIQRMSAEYPALRFAEVYQETGMSFVGYNVYKSGEQIASEYEDMEYPEYRDDMTDEEESEFYDKQEEIENDYFDKMFAKAMDTEAELLQ